MTSSVFKGFTSVSLNQSSQSDKENEGSCFDASSGTEEVLHPSDKPFRERTVCEHLDWALAYSYNLSTRLLLLALVRHFQERVPLRESPRGQSVCHNEALSCGQSWWVSMWRTFVQHCCWRTEGWSTTYREAGHFSPVSIWANVWLVPHPVVLFSLDWKIVLRVVHNLHDFILEHKTNINCCE